ncbi:cell division protein FtsZ [mine drainage metagenome]|uniref:Cell division protein FtsZ n=1 Tax=mine drainage metagenome TaxID=410659 RepID=A0A1J5TEM2_9ZZZZ
MDSELPLEQSLLTDRDLAIKLVGVGGGGSNAVDRLKMDNLDRVQMAVVNTDLQALSASPVQEKVLIGSGVTRGLGAGGDPDLGREAAESDRAKIAPAVKDQDLVFIVAGMGGGTGTGAAPVVAEIAVEQGALVIAFVTMPFSFEGGRRLKQAEEGLAALRRVADAVILLPNNVLLQEAAENESVLDSFARADEWIGRGVKAIWGMLLRTGMINVDFATLRQAFQSRGGKTLFGLGSGEGENASARAIESLRLCPLLATPENARKADRLLVNITAGPDLATHQVNALMQAITEEFGLDSHVVMGAVIDEAMKGRVEVVVLGTTDIGGRGRSTVRSPATPLRARPSARPAPAAAPGAASETPRSDDAGVAVVAEGAPAAVAAAPAHVASSAPAKAPAQPVSAAKPDTSQEEFSFGEVESRGHFENTDRNLFEGQDLDVPTYLRKGIKLML